MREMVRVLKVANFPTKETELTIIGAFCAISSDI
jgi:hypothetical protein